MTGDTATGARGTLSVVVPVYCNEASLRPLFDELITVERALAERDVGLELIFVDDGSLDGSWRVLRDLKEKRPATRLIRLTRNFGAVHASKTGFRYVTGDCFSILAADLQDPPELLIRTVDRWLAGSKFVVCARADREDGGVGRVFSWLHYRLLRLLVLPDYPRGGFDLALMSREMLPHMIESAKHVNTPLFAWWLGFQPETIHYVRRRRQYGRSRWTLRKRVDFFVDSLVGFSILPLRALSALGLLVACASFAYGSLIGLNALRGVRPVPGFATLAVSVSFFSGLVLVMLGVIGEYVWRIYDEVSRKPETVVEEAL